MRSKLARCRHRVPLASRCQTAGTRDSDLRAALPLEVRTVPQRAAGAQCLRQLLPDRTDIGCRCPSTARRSSRFAISWSTTSIQRPARATFHARRHRARQRQHRRRSRPSCTTASASRGGPAATYLFFAAEYNEHTQTLYRGGLFELPLAQSPGERLDDLQAVRLLRRARRFEQSAALVAALGADGGKDDRQLARRRVVALAASIKARPYGGKPVPTGETTWIPSPELSVWLRQTLAQTKHGEFDIGAIGARRNARRTAHRATSVCRPLRALRVARHTPATAISTFRRSSGTATTTTPTAS